MANGDGIYGKVIRVNDDQPHIRLAVPAEADDIASVLYDAFLEYSCAYTPDGLTATTPTAKQLRKRWREGPVWVTLQHGRIVGTVGAVPTKGAVYVRSMAILPASRGRGIGKLLLEHVERFAVENGYRQLFLSTTPFLNRAIRLYEQCGFAAIDEGPRELHGTPLITMVKQLLPPSRAKTAG